MQSKHSQVLFCIFEIKFHFYRTSLVAQTVKNPSAMQETWVRSLGWEDPLEEDMQPTPVFLPGESPWTEEPGGLQSTGLKRVGHDWATKHSAQGQASDMSVAGKPTGTLMSWNTQRIAAI